MNTKSIFYLTISLFTFHLSYAQPVNNLTYPTGYQTAELGQLKIEQFGEGERPFLLIADVGFTGNYFNNFLEGNSANFDFHVVTLPGTTELAGYTIPSGSYANHSWLNAIDLALYRYVSNKNLKEMIIGGHLVIATHVALSFALKHPDIISHTIIMSGQPYASWPSPKDPSGKTPVSIEERKGSIDYFMAPRFYKTISKEDWNKGLYQPQHYSPNIGIGNELYQQTTTASMPVMIQMLCEYFTTDFSLQFDQVSVPTLILQPDFSNEYLAKNPTHQALFYDYWDAAKSNSNFTFKTISNARLSLGYEQIELVSMAIQDFIR